HGGLPEWPKGAVCKTAGSAYVGSNPTPATQLQAPIAGPVVIYRPAEWLPTPGQLCRQTIEHGPVGCPAAGLPAPAEPPIGPVLRGSAAPPAGWLWPSRPQTPRLSGPRNSSGKSVARGCQATTQGSYLDSLGGRSPVRSPRLFLFPI